MTLLRGSPDFHQTVRLDDYPLPEVVELGTDLGADIMYSSIEKADDGDVEWARQFFVYNGVAHVQYVECTELAEVRKAETKEQVDEFERKQDFAEELLDNYSEVMNDA
jgi:F0F1-type ATP synthase epsilon subunit